MAFPFAWTAISRLRGPFAPIVSCHSRGRTAPTADVPMADHARAVLPAAWTAISRSRGHFAPIVSRHSRDRTAPTVCLQPLDRIAPSVCVSLAAPAVPRRYVRLTAAFSCRSASARRTPVVLYVTVRAETASATSPTVGLCVCAIRSTPATTVRSFCAILHATRALARIFRNLSSTATPFALQAVRISVRPNVRLVWNNASRCRFNAYVIRLSSVRAAPRRAPT